MRVLRLSLWSFSVLAMFFAALFSSSTSALAALPDRIGGPIDSSQMVALANHVSPLAQPRYDQGPIESSYPLRLTMLFTATPAQQAALQQLLAEQQDSKSANFHRWLTPEQYADRFGLSPSDIDKIGAWLESQGLKVVYVARGRDAISFSGSAALVQNAFKTQIHRYNIKGEAHFSNSTAPMIPAALIGIVGGFRGLHNFVPRRMSVLHNANSALLHPDYTFTVGQNTYTALAPGDLAIIYDINPLYQANPVIDGTGQKIVIVGQTDIYLADINDFRSDFGLSTIPSSSSSCAPSTASGEVGVITSPCDTTNFEFVIPTTAVDPGVNAGDLSESDLDIEVSGSVARNAQIIFVTSDYGSGGVSNSAEWAIDNNLAPVISFSYGLCEAYSTPPSLALQDAVFQKAQSEGIAVFAAAGDSGAAICDDDVFSNPVSSATLGLSVSYPASSPEVTAVGGTEFNEGNGIYWGTTNGTNGASVLPNGPDNGYIPELAWNDTTFSVQQSDGLDATGGGPSNCANGTGTTTEDGNPFVICTAPPNGGFAKPAFQSALTPNDSVRDVPDISFSASNVNDPYVVCTPQSETSTSSTSSTSTCVNGITEALVTYNSAFGGTSAATPVAAGMAVLLNQYLGTNVGNPNTQLYAFYGTNASAFHDILAGSSANDGDTSDNIVPCTAGTPSFEPSALQCPAGGTMGYSAGTGYDLVTGLGSIDFNVLFQAWLASLPSFTIGSAPGTVSVAAGQSSAPITISVTPATGFTGTVTFSCSGLPTGATCSFSPTSSATSTTLTIQTSPLATTGAATVTVTGTAGGVSKTATVALTVTATTETFSIATSGSGSFSVAAGAAASVPISVTGTNGFIVTNGGSSSTAAPVTYTCANLPSEANCNFSPAITTSSTSVTLSVTTVAPTAQLRRPLDQGSRILYAAMLPGLFGLVFVARSRKGFGGSLRMLSLILFLGFSTLWLGACGNNSTSSGNSNPGTPAGTYTVTVNGSAGGSIPNASFRFTLVVTQ